MSKPALFALFVVLAGGLVTLRQGQPDTTLRDTPVISMVSVDAAGTLIISGAFAQDCAGAPQAEVQRFPANLDIQLSRERSSLTACGMQAVSFNTSLDLAADSLPPFLVINGEAWATTVAEPGRFYHRQSLFPVNIDEAGMVMIDAESGPYQLRFRGSQAIGCDLPELYTLRRADGRIQIGVYNALRSDFACPDRLVEVNETLNLPATELPAATLFEVNALLIEELETNNVSDSDKVLTNITRVSVNVTESLPAQVSLDIEGEHPDGCDLPVQVAQARADRFIQVDIYRIVPADLICPMILQPYKGTIALDGNFESGRYTIHVNSHSQTLNI